MTSIERIAIPQTPGQTGGQKPAGRTGVEEDARNASDTGKAARITAFINFVSAQVNNGKLSQQTDNQGQPLSDALLADIEALVAEFRQLELQQGGNVAGAQPGQSGQPGQNAAPSNPLEQAQLLASQLAQLFIQDDSVDPSLPGQLPAGIQQLLDSFSQSPAAPQQPPATDTTGAVTQNVTAFNGSAENGQTPRPGGVGAGGIFNHQDRNGPMSSAAEMRAEIKAEALQQAQAQKGHAPANNHAPTNTPAQNAPDNMPAPAVQNSTAGQAHAKAGDSFLANATNWLGGDTSFGTSGGNAGGYGTDGSMNGSAQQQNLQARGLHGAQPNGHAFGHYLAASGGKVSHATQMLQMQIQRGVDAKIDSMTVKLQPAALGKVDVKLEFGDDGLMKAHLSVEKPETLNMLQKDAQSLERMLADAGINLDDSALSFSLQHGATDERQSHEAGSGGGKQSNAPGIGETETIETDMAAFMNGQQPRTGIDITV